MNKTTDVLLNLPRMSLRLGVPPGFLRERALSGAVPCIRAGKNKFLFEPRAVELALSREAAGLDVAALLQPLPDLLNAIWLAVGGSLLQANAKSEIFADVHSFLRRQSLAGMDAEFKAGNVLLCVAGGGVLFDALVSPEYRDQELASIAGQVPHDSHVMSFDLLGIRNFIINQMVDGARQRSTAGGT